MFKIKANPTFEATVKIPAPDGDQSLTLVFKHKTRQQVKEFFGAIAAEEQGGGVPEGERMCELIEGWKDVDTPFSAEAMSALVQNYHAAPSAIFEAYISALTQAKQGN
jgi:hypothetical protein